MKCTEWIVQDHINLRRALDILDAMINKLERSERIEIADAWTVLKFITVFGVEYPIRQNVVEQNELRAMLSAIDEALKSRRGIQFVRQARELIELVKNQLERGSDVLPLFGEDDETMLATLTQHRKQTGPVSILSTLEWRYMSKPFATPRNTSRHLPQAQGTAGR